jgi:hypothetical protein
MTTTETTPLIARLDAVGKATSRFGSWLRWAVSVENRILFAGFLITLSFTFTQVP